MWPFYRYAAQAGQAAAIVGERFPPGDLFPISCQFEGPSGVLPAQAVAFVSSTRLQCPVPLVAEEGIYSITLLLVGTPPPPPPRHAPSPCSGSETIGFL
jgi:hypothetical protein